MRKSKQIILALIASVVLVGLFWYAGYSRSNLRTVTALVVNDNIAAGQIIEKKQLKEIQIVAGTDTSVWISSLEEAVGLYAARDIKPGEVLVFSQLKAQPAGVIYPGATKGRRLMTIALDPADANGFWLSDGSLIDLYLIPKQSALPDQLEVMRSICILKVMRAGGNDGWEMKAGHNTLLCLDLSVKQAEKLALSLENCVIRLAALNENSG